MLLLIRMRSVCMKLNTNVIRDWWNVHSFCDARAQLLGNVHNISDTCTTSLKRAQHLWNVHIYNTWKHWVGAVKHVIPIYIYTIHIYIYTIHIYIYIYIKCICPSTKRLCATCFCFCHWGFGIAGTGLIERPQSKPTMTAVMERIFYNKTLPKPDLDADM